VSRPDDILASNLSEEAGYIKDAFRMAIGMSGDIFSPTVESSKGILSKHVNLPTDAWNY
jgi:hypothetical protein